MLRVRASQVEMLWDELLPSGARELPADLAQLDTLLADSALLGPFRAHCAAEAQTRTADLLGRGRPTVSMATYPRLMVVKHRTGWGYESLMREVSDSLHLRRVCLIPLSAPVPDESTVRARGGWCAI